MHMLKLNMPLHILRHVPLRRLRVDIGQRLEQMRDMRRRALRGRDVGHEREDVAGLNRTEDGGHEADEEVEGGELEEGDEAGAVPEDEGDDEEGEALREGVEPVGPDGCPVRFTERLLEGLAVDGEAVFFTGERGDSADGGGGFAGELGRVFVRLLVLLVLEDDDTLIRRNEVSLRTIRVRKRRCYSPDECNQWRPGEERRLHPSLVKRHPQYRR